MNFTIVCEHWQPSEQFFRGRCSRRNNQPAFGECVDLCLECRTTRAELNEYIRGLPRRASEKQIPPAPDNNWISLAIQYCGQVCGKRRTGCDVTICKIRGGFVCPEGKWAAIKR